MVYGERSALFPRGTIDYMSTLLDKSTPVIVMPEVHHHLFLEQPLAFIKTVQTLLTGWQHPVTDEVGGRPRMPSGFRAAPKGSGVQAGGQVQSRDSSARPRGRTKSLSRK